MSIRCQFRRELPIVILFRGFLSGHQNADSTADLQAIVIPPSATLITGWDANGRA